MSQERIPQSPSLPSVPHVELLSNVQPPMSQRQGTSGATLSPYFAAWSSSCLEISLAPRDGISYMEYSRSRDIWQGTPIGTMVTTGARIPGKANGDSLVIGDNREKDISRKFLHVISFSSVSTSQ